MTTPLVDVHGLGRLISNNDRYRPMIRFAVAGFCAAVWVGVLALGAALGAPISETVMAIVGVGVFIVCALAMAMVDGSPRR